MLNKFFGKKLPDSADSADSAKSSAESSVVLLTAKEMSADEKTTLTLIAGEFKRGFDFIRKQRSASGKSVTFFGSARFDQDSEYCEKARLLAKRVVEELGYSVVSGGGQGIMEAVNHGASEASEKSGDANSSMKAIHSVGITVNLPHEQKLNPYIKDSIALNYFFVRKTMLTFAAEAFVFMPGGFGTLDEFFDIMTLVQTEKIPRVPLILVGTDYWQPLDQFIKKQLVEKYKTISPNEVELYYITDNPDQVIEIIRKSPVRNWWKNFEMVER